MKLRKMLASIVAIVACFAMLSTTAFAASELTLTTGKDGDKVKTTISGAVEGQVTFLAVNAGTTISDSTAPADMQYIDQQTKAASADTEISFAKRAGGTDTVDIYAGGTNVTEVAVAYGVAVTESATVTGTTAFEVENNVVPADDAQWLAWLQGKVSVSYTELGSTTPTTVTLTSSNSADFAVTASAEAGVHTIAVTYKGLAAGNVTVTEIVPPAPIVSIAVTGIGEAIDVYVDSALDEATAIAKAQEVEITVNATRDDDTIDPYTEPITGYTYEWNEEDQTVEIKYGEHTAPEKFTFTAIVRAYTGVKTSEGSLNLNIEDLGVTSIGEATVALVENAVKTSISTTGFAPEYTWNDPEKANTAVPAENFAYSTVEGASTAELKTFAVTVTTKEAAGSVVAGTALGTITVEVSAATATVIKGTVTVADTTGYPLGFGATAPVGAVVTAIRLTEDGNGGNFAADGYKSFAAATGNGGAFELEVEEGTYQVLVAHAKFEFFEGELYISRTVKYQEEVTIGDGAEVDLGTINLKYAFFGDTDLDGDVDSDDYAAFARWYNKSVN